MPDFFETVLGVTLLHDVMLGAGQHEQRTAHRLLADAAARELPHDFRARRLTLLDLVADQRERYQQHERHQKDRSDFYPQSTCHRLPPVYRWGKRSRSSWLHTVCFMAEK
jgi:hypothetical protein